MRNKGTLNRMFFALSLMLALGVGAQAQQAAQTQPAPRAEAAAEKSAKASEVATKAADEKWQQPSAEGEPLPLSDAELEKVEGGLLGIKLPSINIKFPSFNINIKSNNRSYNRCR
jgi:hypothetical protein